MTTPLPTVDIYTDGACSGNPGPGGWGVYMIYNDHRKDLYGSDPDTTNNKMELLAAIKGLEALKEPCCVNLFTDSKYVRSGITEWINNWQKNNWKTASKAPVKNVELWQELLKLSKKHTITWIWVKGHGDNAGNNRADALAVKGKIEACKKS